jgi:hypothetical protein
MRKIGFAIVGALLALGSIAIVIWNSVPSASTLSNVNLASDTTVGNSTKPTVVTLSTLEAIVEDNVVLVRWKTGSELNTAGFNVYRSTDSKGELSKINDQLIPAALASLSGAAYEFRDLHIEAQQTYYYMLEEVDLTGKSQRFGPIQPIYLTASKTR